MIWFQENLGEREALLLLRLKELLHEEKDEKLRSLLHALKENQPLSVIPSFDEESFLALSVLLMRLGESSMERLLTGELFLELYGALKDGASSEGLNESFTYFRFDTEEYYYVRYLDELLSEHGETLPQPEKNSKESIPPQVAAEAVRLPRIPIRLRITEGLEKEGGELVHFLREEGYEVKVFRVKDTSYRCGKAYHIQTALALTPDLKERKKGILREYRKEHTGGDFLLIDLREDALPPDHNTGIRREAREELMPLLRMQGYYVLHKHEGEWVLRPGLYDTEEEVL